MDENLKLIFLMAAETIVESLPSSLERAEVMIRHFLKENLSPAGIAGIDPGSWRIVRAQVWLQTYGREKAKGENSEHDCARDGCPVGYSCNACEGKQ